MVGCCTISVAEQTGRRMGWEKRWHPLREEWVTITSHRNTRPWSGALAESTIDQVPEYLDTCYLCPGNQRISGARNPDYQDIFVFDNDHPSFSATAPDPEQAPGIYRSAPARGSCRVVCYSPKHNLTLAELPAEGVTAVLASWAAESRALFAQPEVESVLVFENKGEIVGVSNPHPHCQIYATNFVFDTIARECSAVAGYREEQGESLFEAITRTEIDDGRRVVAMNDHAVAFVPYFARFPYECFVVPRVNCQRLDEMERGALEEFAEVLRETLARLDNLWQMSFPYMLIVHQAPAGDHADYRCHIQIHPPLRGPGLQKFLAGVETGGGNFLNDASPEEKAAELREVPAVHYKHTTDAPGPAQT